MEGFLLARFNPRLSESDPPHDEGWLRDRAELFGQFTAPSVRAQGPVSFRWLIFCDSESPTWLIDLLGSTATSGEFVRLPAFSSALIAQEVATRLTTGARLITTRLDNDDAIGRDFMATVYGEAATCGVNTAINVLNGCQLNGETVCLRSDPTDAQAVELRVGQKTLDALAGALTSPDLIKDDVEGAELDVLHGGGSLCESARPELMEVNGRVREDELCATVGSYVSQALDERHVLVVLEESL